MEAVKKIQTVQEPIVTEKNPHIAVEVFLSLAKWFLVIFVITNIIWACVLAHYINKSITDVSHNIEMTQDGQDNNQSITNG